MLELVEALVGLQGIREERGSGQDVLPDFSLQSALFRVANDLHANLATNRLAAPFKDSQDRRLILAARAGDPLRPLLGVHIACPAADERFVGLNLPGQLVSRPHA